MTYLLLALIVGDGLMEQRLSKQYNIKARLNNINLFSAVSCLCALLFFLINSRGQLEWNAAMLPYSIAFAAAFGTATATATFAIRTGPLSLTALFTSYSLLIPTFYGIFFLKDPVSPLLYAGLGVLLVSLYMINRNKEESMKFSPVWILYVALAFVSNGMCSTIQKMQQLKFDGAYKNEFMIAALLLVTAVLFIMGFLQKGDKKEMLKPCLKYGIIKGFGNGMMNYWVMLASALLPTAVLFPTISAGGIVLTYLCAVFIYREKLSRVQTAGYFLGVVSVVLLNL